MAAGCLAIKMGAVFNRQVFSVFLVHLLLAEHSELGQSQDFLDRVIALDSPPHVADIRSEEFQLDRFHDDARQGTQATLHPDFGADDFRILVVDFLYFAKVPNVAFVVLSVEVELGLREIAIRIIAVPHEDGFNSIDILDEVGGD